MNYFSTDDFLQAAHLAFFPGQNLRIEHVRVDGQTYRVLTDANGTPQSSIPFLDVLEPVAGADDGREVGWLEKVETDRETLEVYEARIAETPPVPAQWGRTPFYGVAPYIDWTRVDDFDAFVAQQRKRSSRAFRQIIKTPTGLDKHLDEPAVFTHHSDDPAHLEQCIEWKSAQYLASGYVDIMARGAATLFRELATRDALVVSTLTSGDELVAAHLGALYEGEFYYWLPAYDAQYSKYSPGSVLLEEMIRASHARGDVVFDFLEGNEPYKYFYANAVRTIGEAGIAPIKLRLTEGTERTVAQFLERFPRVHTFASAQKRRIDDFRHR